MHQIQMPGNDRSILGQMIGDGSDIRPPIFHQEFQYFQANRFTEGFEKFRVEVLDQLIEYMRLGCLSVHGWTLMHINAYVNSKKPILINYSIQYRTDTFGSSGFDLMFSLLTAIDMIHIMMLINSIILMSEYALFVGDFQE